MKILFVSMVAFENNTSATIQNKGIIKGLSELGHDVDIMTLEPNENAISYDNSMNDIKNLVSESYYIKLNSNYKILMNKKNNNNHSNIVRDDKSKLALKGFKKTRASLKKLYDQTSIFDAQKANVKQVSKIKLNYSKYDIIISASDPKSSHLIVERIYKENPNCEAKWIQYWGDPMFNDITRKSDWRNRLVKYQEEKLIKKSHKVFYASPLTLEIQKETFPELAFKMDYASQVYADYSIANIVKSKNKLNTDIVNVGYFGAYNSKIRDIMPLYNTAKSGSFNLNICGGSDIILKETKNISVYGAVSYKQVLKKENESDILVCICNKRGTQIPGKIYYCTGYHKPIIVILDGEYKEKLRNYLDSFNRFILCENNETSIHKAIKIAKEKIKDNSFIVPETLTPKHMAQKILR